MKLVNVSNNYGITFQKKMIDPTEWVQECISNGAWGKVAGAYLLESLSEAELATELSRETLDSGQVMVTIPDQFTIVIEDISAQVAEEALREKAMKAVQWSQKLLAEIRYINLKKNLSVQAFMAIMNDTTLQDIERFILNSSFKTAKAYMQGYNGEAYTSEEKASLIALLDQAIAEVD